MEQKETILIVEDNQVLREGLCDILAFEGFNVLAGGNGQEALDQMGDANPDLILSDISMPVMDGYEFYSSVRANPEWVTIPFIFLTARGERDDILKGRDLGVEDYLVKPLTRDELLTAIRGRLNRSQQIRVAQLHHAYESSLTVLANAIDVRDPNTRGHVERVTEYAAVIAGVMGLQGHPLEQVRYGAILHDIGKIIIQESTLFKPSALDEKEWQEIKKHPVSGAEMIKDIPYLSDAVPIVRHHHERWDGKGYPDNLAGLNIPLGARLVSVADGFDAMTIDRPYRRGFSLDEAYQEISRCNGSQYDPQVVEAFQQAWFENKLQPIWKHWSSNGHS
jgi:putative two-component system response regulator